MSNYIFENESTWEENSFDESPSARGKRLKQVRHMTGLSSKDFAEKIGVSRVTVSYWENATHNNSLTYKNAVKVIEVLQEGGIICDILWLLRGVGDIPRYLKNPKKELSVVLPSGVDKRTAVEINYFIEQFDNSVICSIEHNSLNPFLYQTDIVGGIWSELHPNMVGSLILIEYNQCIEVRFLKAIQDNNVTISYLSFDAEKNFNEMHLGFEVKNLRAKRVGVIKRIWRK